MEDVEDTVILPPREVVPPFGLDAATEDTVERAKLPAVPQPEAGSKGLHSVGVPIPTLYRFRVGPASEPIEMDVPAYIGRRPSSPRIVTGVVPRLVRVPSPLSEVSGTHLELRQVGGSIVVTDMKSTNGSIVVVPGSAPRKLRQGESVVVSPGTLVDIGDGNIIEILPMQRVGSRPS